MSVQHIEVLVEEPSMEAALRLLLPRLLVGISFEVYPSQCKQELLDRLERRLRGYSLWLPQDWRVVVVVDRDNEDCHRLKERLEAMARDVGLTTRTMTGGRDYQVVNRLAIEELDAWYFGDWDAVRAAYRRVPENIPRRAKYRQPDNIKGGTREAFERVLRKAGYFKGGMLRVEAARSIAQHWDPCRNTSRSFQVFRDALREMVS
jgi:hypothetical protein